MRPVLLITGSVVVAISLVVGYFTISQADQEQLTLTSRLQSRAQVLSESLAESIQPAFNMPSTSTVQRIIDHFVSSERLAGLGVFDNSGTLVAGSANMPMSEDEKFITTTMDSDEANGEFVRRDDGRYYVHVLPLHENGNVIGALVVAQNATYIDDAVRSIWRDNAIRLILQILLFAAAIFIIVRWVFFRAVSDMVELLQAHRRGASEGDVVRGAGFLKPLAGEISKVTRSLHQARLAASEEARMRLEKLDSPWTAERLQEFVKAYLKDRPIFVLSNGEPYVNSKVKNNIVWNTPAGGVITAIEPVMEACGGM